MGFIGNAAEKVKQYFKGDKERAVYNISKSSTKTPFSSTDYSSFNAGGFSALTDYLEMENDILAKYADYEAMQEGSPELAAALNIFADDATQLSLSLKRTVWVTSSERYIQQMLDDLFQRTLRIDEDIWEIARTLCLYGNVGEEILLDDTGVCGLNYIPPPTMRRIEGPRGELYGFIQDYRGKYGFTTMDLQNLLQNRFSNNEKAAIDAIKQGGNADNPLVGLYDWEVAHFRMKGAFRRSTYGTSVLESSRWIWKRLVLMEDAALIYRLQRAPERFAIGVDIGDIPPGEALAHLEKVRKSTKKKRYIDQNGRLNLKFEAIAPDEDIYIPVRKGVEGARIQTLTSPSWQCLAGETKIPLLDGTTPTIKELADKGPDHTFWVYSVDEQGNVVPGKGYNPRMTHENAEIWEVTLDNGEVVRCTGNHPFMMRDGTYVQAQNLQPEQSLMPLYRKISSKKDGDFLNGYEKVYMPATGKYEYTHRAVFAGLGNSIQDTWKAGKIIHHKDFKKLNNSPSNLQDVTRKEHAAIHKACVTFMHTPEARNKMREVQKTDLYRQHLRESWTNERRLVTAERTKKMMANPEYRATAAKYITAWNKSEKRKISISGSNNPNWVDIDVEKLAVLMKETNSLTMRQLMNNAHIGQKTINKALDLAGLKWKEFVKQYIPERVYKSEVPGYRKNLNLLAKQKREEAKYMNHKVVSVKKTDQTEPVYDISVEKYHNFALQCGSFVHNSVQDIEYFLDKTLSGICIPKAYLGREEGVVRASLSSLDVRFCRTVMRVQRELINGLEKICRIHLASKGIDTDKVDFEVHMTPPSALNEMAQIEAQTAKAQLCSALREHVSLYYVLQEVMNLNDDQIQGIMKQRSTEMEHDLMTQLNAQVKAQQLMQQSMPQQAQGQPGQPGQPQATPQAQPAPQANPGQGGGPQLPPMFASFAYNTSRKAKHLTEQELMKGRDKEAEKRATDKLNTLLKNDHKFAKELEDIKATLQDAAFRSKSQ